jgi:hypothetical protein
METLAPVACTATTHGTSVDTQGFESVTGIVALAWTQGVVITRPEVPALLAFAAGVGGISNITYAQVKARMTLNAPVDAIALPAGGMPNDIGNKPAMPLATTTAG